jgi:flagellar M-ring protein FliF
MNFLKQLQTQLTAQWGQMSPRQRLVIGGVAAAVLLAVGLLVALNRSESYETLFTGLGPEDSAAIRAELTSMAVPFTVDATGGSIQIPPERVAEVRLQLAGRGLFENRDRGFELFDTSSLGMTDFLQNVNYQRALEGELARSIATLHSIERVRVHLVMPRQSLFLEERSEPKASVVLKLRKGKRPAKGEVQAICQLVAAAVEGLKPESVSLVSDQGELLSAPRAGDGEEEKDAAVQAEQFEAVARLEAQVASKVVALLEPIVGEGRVRARATLEIDRTRTDETVETYDPDKSVVRSQQTERSGAGTAEAGGVAGAPANVGDTAGQSSPAGTQRSDQKETINYEVSKSVRRIFGAAGRIRHLSIAVVLDDRLQADASGKPARVSWSAEQLQKLQDIVAAAVGMDAQRGDTVRLDNLSFASGELEEAAAAEAQFGARSFSLPLVLGLLGAGAALLLVLWGWRARRVSVLLPEKAALPAMLTAGKPRSIEEIEAELGGAAMEPINITLDPEVRRASQLKDQILQHIQEEPLLAAELIRSWIAESVGAAQDTFSEEQLHVESSP